jgi:hypothetical protein
MNVTLLHFFIVRIGYKLSIVRHQPTLLSQDYKTVTQKFGLSIQKLTVIAALPNLATPML